MKSTMLNRAYFLAIVTLAALSITTQAQQPCPGDTPCIDGILRFAEYGDISPRDESYVLDSLAAQYRKEPGSMIYLLIYAGQKACVNEANKRAIRARKYLVRKHGIPATRIASKDGGFRVDASTQVWLLPEKSTPPEPYPTLERAGVQLIKRCKLELRIP
jgi:hypothetical protein